MSLHTYKDIEDKIKDVNGSVYNDSTQEEVKLLASLAKRQNTVIEVDVDNHINIFFNDDVVDVTVVVGGESLVHSRCEKNTLPVEIVCAHAEILFRTFNL